MLKDELQEARDRLDLNNPNDQRKWQYIALKYNELISLKQRSIQLNSTCSKAAESFFECLSLEIKYLEARVAYKKQWSEIDLSTSEGQRRWVVVGRVLQRTIESANEDLIVCRAR